MEALSASYSNFFLNRPSEKERQPLPLFSTDFASFPGNGLVLFKARCVGSVSSASSSSQTHLGSEEIQALNFDQPKTVRVRFKLEKQCTFGEQFLVVGDDPSLGIWDPCDGVPLNWSEGHVWTAEVDMPCNKVINYKFILEQIDGSVLWQPGPDRVFETWDTARTISVSEDWDVPDFQNVVEEERVNDSGLNQLLFEGGYDLMDEQVDDDDSLGLLSVDNLKKVVEEGDVATKEKFDGDEGRSDRLNEAFMNMVAENVGEEQDWSISDEEPGLMSGETTLEDRGSVVMNTSYSSSLKNETRLVIDEGIPVLVPGLATMPVEEVKAEEAEVGSIRVVAVSEELVEVTTTSFDEIKDSTVFDDETKDSSDLNRNENNIVEDAATELDEIKDSSDDLEERNNTIVENNATEPSETKDLTDLNEKNDNVVVDATTESDDSTEAATKPEVRVSAVLQYGETRETMGFDETTRVTGKKQFLGNGMQWGRKALNKFLADLGFIQHS